MRKIIEYTLVSVDGIFGDTRGFFEYRDDAYMRDGLGLLLECDAMLFGRTTYEIFAQLWPGRTGSSGPTFHPWADRLNAIQKYVFSSTLKQADWNNSTIVRGDAAVEVTKLKRQEGGNLLMFGHGLLGETLLKQHMLDVLDLSIYPLFVGHGRPFFREGEDAKLKLVAAKTFTNGIVKLTYEPQYERAGT
jgi:dihydrofolate reductase